MTPDEFTAALKALGWKQADFCRRLAIDQHTASRWVTQRTAIPRWVPEYLEAMAAIKKLHEQFVSPAGADARQADATGKADAAGSP